MSDEELMKLALECGWGKANWRLGDFMLAFARRVEAAAYERAIHACENRLVHWPLDSTNVVGETECQPCASAIRSLAKGRTR